MARPTENKSNDASESHFSAPTLRRFAHTRPITLMHRDVCSVLVRASSTSGLAGGYPGAPVGDGGWDVDRRRLLPTTNDDRSGDRGGDRSGDRGGDRGGDESGGDPPLVRPQPRHHRYHHHHHHQRRRRRLSGLSITPRELEQCLGEFGFPPQEAAPAAAHPDAIQ